MANPRYPSEDNKAGYIRALRDVHDILADIHFQETGDVDYETVQNLILALSEDEDGNPQLEEINS